MDHLQGALMVSPDRSHILGRSSWKPRYVVVRLLDAHPNERLDARLNHRAANTGHRSFALSSSQQPPIERAILHRNLQIQALQPLHQWSLDCVVDCQVQMVTNRKHDCVIPTLNIILAEKEQRRRSARNPMLNSNTRSSLTTLRFRLLSDDAQPTLHTWARFILSKRQRTASSLDPLRPRSSTGNSESQLPRPLLSPGLGMSKCENKRQVSTPMCSYRRWARPGSHDSGFRSSQSDGSDVPQTCPMPQSPLFPGPNQHYTTVQSPPNSPTRSLGCGCGCKDALDPSTRYDYLHPSDRRPSANRCRPRVFNAATALTEELDFYQTARLDCTSGAIPGVADQRRLSSAARFHALMVKLEANHRPSGASEELPPDPAAMRSAFEEDDSSDEESQCDSDLSASDDDDELQQRGEGPADKASSEAPSAQRVLTYLAGLTDPADNHDSLPSSSSLPPSSSSPASLSAAPSPSPPAAAATGDDARPSSGNTTAAPNPADGITLPLLSPRPPAPRSPHRELPLAQRMRHSNAAGQRLSVTDFARKMSSTSNLLAVPTKTTSATFRRSERLASPRSSHRDSSRSSQNLATFSRPPTLGINDRQLRCSWRTSVVTHLIGVEGGFV